jgi:3-oxoacyl-(acyl-carrier-protein) synthase
MKDMAGTRTSVHVGCFGLDYQSILSRDQQNIAKYSATGGSGSILSNRISWFFDLLGPSMTIDTACSSSMVAFDLACKGLWNGSVDTVSSLSTFKESHLKLSQRNNAYTIEGTRRGSKSYPVARPEYHVVKYVVPFARWTML